MATLRNVFRTTLEADATLTALLTGGIFDSSELDYSGEGAMQAPRESDGVQLKPHAVIRWKGSISIGPGIKVGGEAETVEVYVYQDVDYDVIESAIIRMKYLLDDVYLTADNRALAHVNKDFMSADIPAEELGMASSRFVRFTIITAPI